MAEDNKGIVRRIVDEVFSRGKVGLADTLVAPGYVYHGPGGLEMRGPDGFKQLVNMYRSAFPDLTVTVDDLIAEGDKVTCRWTGRGTHKGDLAGIAPTGDQMMVVSVDTRGAFTADRPRVLFAGSFVVGEGRVGYDVSPDGEHFLMLKDEQDATTEIVVLLNWHEEVRRLAGAPAR
jgi:predicted SnoaL-like aldol condensation-catalyzing enzyme